MHQVSCCGGGDRILRHDRVRDIVKDAAERAGYRAEVEHAGGTTGQQRPGDVAIFGFDEGRTLLVDVAVIEAGNHAEAAVGGSGSAATAYETRKWKRYSAELDLSAFRFLPFVVEVSGGLGAAAKWLCGTLDEKRKQRLSSHVGKRRSKRARASDLEVVINVAVTRTSAMMVVNRESRSRRYSKGRENFELSLRRERTLATQTLKELAEIPPEENTFSKNTVISDYFYENYEIGLTIFPKPSLIPCKL